MAILDPVALSAGLYISGRRMAALYVEGAGTLHLDAVERDSDGRVVYAYVIDHANGRELETGRDLRSAPGAVIDYPAMMDSFLSMLGYAGSSYARGTLDSPPFSGPVTEWAHMHDDALHLAQSMLTRAGAEDEAEETYEPDTYRDFVDGHDYVLGVGGGFSGRAEVHAPECAACAVTHDAINASARVPL